MYTFPTVTMREAESRGLRMFTAQRGCTQCGDKRRFKLCSQFVCWTCFGGEDYLSNPKVSAATIAKEVRKGEMRVLKATNTLGGIPRVHYARLR